MIRFRWPRILAVVFLLVMVLAPVRAVVAKSSDDAFGMGLGARRAAFEANYGKPASTKGAGDFKVGTQYDLPGYKSVFVFWRHDTAAHIVLNARSGWPGAKASDIVRRWIPNDARNTGAGGGANTAGLQWVTTFGHSDALSRRFSAQTYQQLEVEGKQGDFRVAMVKSATNTDEFATIDIAIGKDVTIGQAASSQSTRADGSSDMETSPKANDSTDKDNSAGAAYLRGMRQDMNQLGKGMNQFTTIMKQDTISKTDVTTLTDIAQSWTDAYDQAKQADAPQGFAKFGQQYTALTRDLSEVADGFTTYLSSNGQDTASLTNAAHDFNAAVKTYNELSDELGAVGY